jgi:hypothetical protein
LIYERIFEKDFDKWYRGRWWMKPEEDFKDSLERWADQSDQANGAFFSLSLFAKSFFLLVCRTETRKGKQWAEVSGEKLRLSRIFPPSLSTIKSVCKWGWPGSFGHFFALLRSGGFLGRSTDVMDICCTLSEAESLDGFSMSLCDTLIRLIQVQLSERLFPPLRLCLSAFSPLLKVGNTPLSGSW